MCLSASLSLLSLSLSVWLSCLYVHPSLHLLDYFSVYISGILFLFISTCLFLIVFPLSFLYSFLYITVLSYAICESLCPPPFSQYTWDYIFLHILCAQSSTYPYLTPHRHFSLIRMCKHTLIYYVYDSLFYYPLQSLDFYIISLSLNHLHTSASSHLSLHLYINFLLYPTLSYISIHTHIHV